MLSSTQNLHHEASFLAQSQKADGDSGYEQQQSDGNAHIHGVYTEKLSSETLTGCAWRRAINSSGAL